MQCLLGDDRHTGSVLILLGWTRCGIEGLENAAKIKNRDSMNKRSRDMVNIWPRENNCPDMCRVFLTEFFGFG